MSIYAGFSLGSKKMFVRWSNIESVVRTSPHLRSKSEFCLLLVLNSSHSFIMEKLSVIHLYGSGKYSATSTLPFGKKFGSPGHEQRCQTTCIS